MNGFFDRCVSTDPALIVGESSVGYGELVRRIDDTALPGVPRGAVVALVGGFDATTVATLFALWERGCVVVPMGARNAEREAIAEAEFVVEAGCVEPTGRLAGHPLLTGTKGPRLVLFTSGTTSVPKAVLHDVERWLEKLARPGRRQRTLAFLSFDHVGGLNTLLYALANGGTVVVPEDRVPAVVWEAIARHEVELLPTTPTFLRLSLLDGPIPAVPSLRLVAYGSEPMPEATLAAAQAALPEAEFLQQYGMSELGVLRSRSRGDGSTWVRLQNARVVDGLLEVRSDTAMRGYLNAPSPFTEDGWLRTGDEADQQGEYFRIRGRRVETINVGGEKVHPAEVESRLESLRGVTHAVVRGEPNPMLGHVVVAAVALADDEPIESFRVRMRTELKGALPRYALPQRVERLKVQEGEGGMTERGKKIRVPLEDGGASPLPFGDVLCSERKGTGDRESGESGIARSRIAERTQISSTANLSSLSPPAPPSPGTNPRERKG